MNPTMTTERPGAAISSEFIIRSVEPRSLLMQKTTAHRRDKNGKVNKVPTLHVLSYNPATGSLGKPVATLWRVNFANGRLEYDCGAFECYQDSTSESLARIPRFDFVPAWMRDPLQGIDMKSEPLTTYLWMLYPSPASDLDTWLSENDKALMEASDAIAVARSKKDQEKSTRQSQRLRDHRRRLLGLSFGTAE